MMFIDYEIKRRIMKSWISIMAFQIFTTSVFASDITLSIEKEIRDYGKLGIYNILNSCLDFRTLFLNYKTINDSINKKECIVDFGRNISLRYALTDDTTLKNVLSETKVDDEVMLAFINRTKLQVKIIQQYSIIQSHLREYPDEEFLNIKLHPGDIVVCIFSLPY